jgi:hypothetical protein
VVIEIEKYSNHFGVWQWGNGSVAPKRLQVIPVLMVVVVMVVVVLGGGGDGGW